MANNQKKTCPGCYEETLWEELSEFEDIEVRGDVFNVRTHYFRCPECGEDFENMSDPTDSLDLAYREYRKKHDMMQPEEIKNLRKKYNLTQKEFAAILGWGDATLSRYENGCLQDESHDKMLHLCLSPRNLQYLLEKTPNAVRNSKKRETLFHQLKTELDSRGDMNSLWELLMKSPKTETESFCVKKSCSNEELHEPYNKIACVREFAA